MTGASGFLGRALCQLLAEAGAEVHGTWRSRPTAPDVHDHHAVLPADALDLIARIEPKRVFHLASPIDHRTDLDAWKMLRPGIFDASIAVARGAASVGARLIHIGTCAEYGRVSSPLRETQICRPVSAYGGLKLAATEAILAMTRQSDLDACVLRPFRAHGPHDKTSLVAQACHAAVRQQPLAITSGEQIREWNGVYEIAEGIMAAGAHPETRGRILNIGGGPRASVREVASTLFDLAEAPSHLLEIGGRPPRDQDVSELWSDSSEARTLLALSPSAPLEESLADTLDWHRRRMAEETSG